MLYLPNTSYQRRFSLLSLPLPPKLLPWLISDRGLAIYILPQGRVQARLFLRRNLNIYDEVIDLEEDLRPTVGTPHYRPRSRRIIIPHETLYSNKGNVLLHEVGHAVDHLYLAKSSKKLFSSYRDVIRALRPEKPLDAYCASKYRRNKDLQEQFATAFEAYFCEPGETTKKYHHDITDLSPQMIDIFNRHIHKNFSRVRFDGEKK
jgi:hypothetical protein